jgi:hypothetical protein
MEAHLGVLEAPSGIVVAKPGTEKAFYGALKLKDLHELLISLVRDTSHTKSTVEYSLCSFP